MRPRVYVSGPIRLPATRAGLARNIEQATYATAELIKDGFAVFCPHLSCYMGGNTPSAGGRKGIADEAWLEMDFSFISVCQALLRLPGASVGSDLEVAYAENCGVPVYYDLDDIIADRVKLAYACADDAKKPVPDTTAGHAGYLAILDEMKALHCLKASDYGRGQDPLANIRAGADFGIPAWQGVMIRANDKMHRIKSYCINKSLKNESLEDSLKDLAAYSLLALALLREDNAKTS